MLREGRNRPEQLLRPPPVGCGNPGLYADWLAEPRQHSRTALMRRYEATITITSPTGRPKPTDTTHTTCFDQAHHHVTAHKPDHPATATWTTVQAFYDEPYNISITNSAKYPSTSLNVRPLNNMLSDTTDIYALPPIAWGTQPSPRAHTPGSATHSHSAPAPGLPLPSTARQPLQVLPLTTSRSSAPAVDMFALTYQAPAQGRLENIQPDFSTTNLLPPTPLVSPTPNPCTTAHAAPPIYGSDQAATVSFPIPHPTLATLPGLDLPAAILALAARTPSVPAPTVPRQSGAKTSTPKPPGPKVKSPARSKARPLTLQSHLSGTAGAASVFIPTPVTYTAATHLSTATNNIPPVRFSQHPLAPAAAPAEFTQLGRWTEPVKFVYGASDPYAPAPQSGATASQSYTSSSDTSSSGGTSSASAPVHMSTAK
ncbi:hypothetical protein B484DRAFT_436037, partial [Ochromonadaceae sp. CCMP2298]